MPREVVHIQVGQCGNQIGTKFWETIAQEHGLAPDGMYCGNNPVQLEKIDVFYHETSTGQFVPRAVLVDMENSVLNHITSRTYGKMFRPENFLSTTEGAANNFMNGFYSQDANRLCDNVQAVLRKEVERSQCCQGFTFSHSASGGTGSGLSMRIWNRTQDLLVPSFGGIYFFTVLPSSKVSNTVIEPYNSMLVLRRLHSAENVVCLDNEALYRICFDTLGLDTPTFGDLNRLISMVMAGNTASFRFPGQINTDMNKLSYSLRARPFLHYYIPSFSPLTALKNQPYRQLTVSELVKQMTSDENMMVETTPAKEDKDSMAQTPQGEAACNGRCFSYAALFRGAMTSQDVDEALVFLRGPQALEEDLRSCVGYGTRLNLILESVKTCQLYWGNPRPTFNTVTSYAPPGMPMSVTYIRNSSVIKFKFLKILREAMKMHSTRSFVHWYAKENFPGSGGDFENLDDCLNFMAGEWMPEFGTEDGSNFPTILKPEEIAASMIM